MKTKTLLLMATVLLLIVFQSCEKSDMKESTVESPLIGAWEYILDDYKGMCICTDTHFSWTITLKEQKSFEGEAPTETEKAEAFWCAI